jgi:hypothetical protein
MATPERHDWGKILKTVKVLVAVLQVVPYPEEARRYGLDFLVEVGIEDWRPLLARLAACRAQLIRRRRQNVHSERVAQDLGPTGVLRFSEKPTRNLLSKLTVALRVSVRQNS